MNLLPPPPPPDNKIITITKFIHLVVIIVAVVVVVVGLIELNTSLWCSFVILLLLLLLSFDLSGLINLTCRVDLCELIMRAVGVRIVFVFVAVFTTCKKFLSLIWILFVAALLFGLLLYNFLFPRIELLRHLGAILSSWQPSD